jgi:hypothetical protein
MQAKFKLESPKKNLEPESLKDNLHEILGRLEDFVELIDQGEDHEIPAGPLARTLRFFLEDLEAQITTAIGSIGRGPGGVAVQEVATRGSAVRSPEDDLKGLSRNWREAGGGQ